MYFVKAVPGLIDNTEVPGLLVDYTKENKVVSVDVRMASVRTRAQFCNADTESGVSNTPPAGLHTKYCQEADSFTVSFVDSPHHCRSVCTDDDNASVWVDNCEKWESIVIACAGNSIAK